MKTYKLPVNVFEKDLNKKTRKYIKGTEFSINRNFYFYLTGIGLTISLIYFQLNYDFISWVKPWNGNAITIKADSLTILENASPKDELFALESFSAPDNSALTLEKIEPWKSTHEDAIFYILDSTDKIIFSGNLGRDYLDYNFTFPETNGTSNASYKLKMQNRWTGFFWQFWQALVEFILTCIILLIVWAIIANTTDFENFYTWLTLNEKVVSTRLKTELFLKLDFKSQSKNGKDETGSIYVNSPFSDYLKEVYTLEIKNRRIRTIETIDKYAHEINDFDDHVELDKLVVTAEEQNILDSGFVQVLAGGNEMKIYKDLVESMNYKYGINVLRIEYLIVPFWECKVKNNSYGNRVILIDSNWGNEIDFQNLKSKYSSF